MSKSKIILFLYLICPAFSFAGTVVGNGGEPILHYLEASRFALIETLRDIHSDPKKNAEFCSKESQLNTDQKSFCREYMLEILDQVITLNLEPKKVPFVLREDPLLVVGPDGKPMPVSARTELGSQGPIEFHLDSIKLMAPKDLLQLVAHEFQHKTTYKNNNPTDNDSIGPFQYGRFLIDSVASAIVKVAIDTGRIGTQFVLRDSFECVIRSGSSQFGMRASTQRWFFDSSLTSYKTSLSELPTDPFIFVSETIDSKIVFQLNITDKNHCQNLNDPSLRQSRVALWRVFNDPQTPSQLISEQKFPGMNPLCEKVSPLFTADFQAIHFECKYYGTEAQ